MFENISPVDGSLISEVYEGKQAEINQAVAAAKAALDGPWGKMTQDERSAILHNVADGVTAR
ncbi:MAG: aldehyde dehydrogenase family protein, partial [Alphaproteobacteria bacterium]|nr:aldehyde dehydrogenase family protein [Alphaproteobacteria bacterium]